MSVKIILTTSSFFLYISENTDKRFSRIFPLNSDTDASYIPESIHKSTQTNRLLVYIFHISFNGFEHSIEKDSEKEGYRYGANPVIFNYLFVLS